jgi:transketolase
VIYDNDESFVVGGSKTLRQSPDDQVTIVAAGVTVHNALAAADQLAADGLNVRIIDAYSVKPIDHDGIAAAVQSTQGRLVVVEDHYPEGGLAAAVLESLVSDGRPLRLVHCAVRGLPGSGKPEELMDAAGISARHIVDAAKSLLPNS